MVKTVLTVKRRDKDDVKIIGENSASLNCANYIFLDEIKAIINKANELGLFEEECEWAVCVDGGDFKFHFQMLDDLGDDDE